MNTAISCDLIENALDYLLLAGEQVQQEGQRMSKHAVATLADGVELLLKARIEQRDWCLIFKDVDKASRQNYESGDFISITFDQAIKRLRGVCDVQISDGHLTIINDIRQQRNRIRHFAITLDEQVAVSLVAKTFAFALEFVSEHLPDAGEQFSDDFKQLRELLGNFDEFIDERFEQIQDELDNHSSVVLDCPICLQPALVIEGDKTRCLFCKHEAQGEQVASEWTDRFLPFQRLKHDLISPQIRECPECGADSCVDACAETDGRVGYICFTCGIEGDYQDCMSCASLCDRDSVGGMCDGCRENIMSRND